MGPLGSKADSSGSNWTQLDYADDFFEDLESTAFMIGSHEQNRDASVRQIMKFDQCKSTFTDR